MAEILVETHDLTKRYGSTKRSGSVLAVDNLNMSVEEGEIYGFLGPNGSGKTTTILMLLGLTEPTAGYARVTGLDPLQNPLEVKRNVGYLPENVGFYEDMTGRQNMRYIGQLNRIPKREADDRIDKLLGLVGLSEAADRAVAGYSRGMRQRLGIADTLLKQPRVAFLDDPTIGLDPEGIHELLDIIVGMASDLSITIFLSSHILQQVQRICSRVGIMFRGSLVAQGTVAELSKAGSGAAGLRLEIGVAGNADSIADSLREVPGVLGVTTRGGEAVLDCVGDVRGAVASKIMDSGMELRRFVTVDKTLEDIYMYFFRQAEAAAEASAS